MDEDRPRRKAMSAEQDRDKYSQGIETALSRAAKKARELARQTGTKIVVVRDGKLIKETPPADEQAESA